MLSRLRSRGIDVERAFLEHSQDLFQFLCRYGGDSADAMDAVQEAFLCLQTKPPRDAVALRSWLFRTGLNALRDVQRSRTNRSALVRRHADRVPQPRPYEPVDSGFDSGDRLRLREALEGLRERERTALLMRESGFKHREIAEALGTTTATVGTLIARSLGKLSQALAMEAEACTK